MSRGLGDVYKRQEKSCVLSAGFASGISARSPACLLYTSDAADDTPCVDLGGRRIIKKLIFFFL
ncbi:hypothetical protein, partial [Staphylococcus aureus]